MVQVGTGLGKLSLSSDILSPLVPLVRMSSSLFAQYAGYCKRQMVHKSTDILINKMQGRIDYLVCLCGTSSVLASSMQWLSRISPLGETYRYCFVLSVCSCVYMSVGTLDSAA